MDETTRRDIAARTETTADGRAAVHGGWEQKRLLAFAAAFSLLGLVACGESGPSGTGAGGTTGSGGAGASSTGGNSAGQGGSGSGGRTGSGGTTASGGTSASGGRGGGMGGAAGAGRGGGAGRGTGGTGGGATGGTPGSAGSGGASDREAKCRTTGGKATTGACCSSISDFPEMCSGLIGICGCPPSNSHTISLCECPSGKCFDSTQGCVTPPGLAP
jgi:hypothetical protein